MNVNEKMIWEVNYGSIKILVVADTLEEAIKKAPEALNYWIEKHTPKKEANNNRKGEDKNPPNPYEQLRDAKIMGIIQGLPIYEIK